MAVNQCYLNSFINDLTEEVRKSMRLDYIYTVPELAEILKVNKNKVLELIHKGHLNALKLGRYKVTRKELQRFLNDSKGMDLTDLDNVRHIKKKGE